MVEVAYVSDCHFEINDRLALSKIKKIPAADVLVLAGDLFYASHFKPERTDKMAARSKYFAEALCSDVFPKFKHVLMVLGNHDYWDSIYSECHDLISGYMSNFAPNFTLLNGNSVDIDGVEFWGHTMWTDYANGHPNVMMACQYGMNDYRKMYLKNIDQIEYIDRMKPNWKDSVKVLPEFLLGIHQGAREKLAKTIHDSKPKRKMVVITHHAPSVECVAGQYRTSGDINFAYYAKLDHLVESPKVSHWIHGHTHHNTNIKTAGGTIVSNQIGYIGHEDREATFDPEARFVV